MVFLSDIFQRIKFWKECDRLGPDIPYTHWMLYFKTTMLHLCKRKFKYFDDAAEFRPGAYAVSCSNIHIGKGVTVRPQSMLFADAEAGITIEDEVLLGSGVHMYTNNHRFNETHLPIKEQGYKKHGEILIQRGSWIGANSIILAGVTIGKNSVVGAGSVVTKSVPDKTVVAGVPATIIRYLQ